ncbi:GyrI-like domain-containing protein [Actinokineospora fastidiosa]|uniref:DNA gyrase inhibitor n=1 Tax=Actinokineospora fastidiosa TaxID=1816 RepID=A0A918GI33_9PSEU|nr:GyrI-like domain-containing protein [Actinokineospora fastidiosa]GGS38958.1 DNA gyrase inhibitor [Actinokineospora fastidiosa]
MEPRIEDRPAVSYAGITEKATLAEWGRVNALVPEVLEWLTGHGIAPAGPPLYRYYAGDATTPIEVEVGWPVAGDVPASDRVRAGVLPAGRYAVLVHRGHPDRIAESFGVLESWAAREAVRWDVTEGRWACRYESYRTDPQVEPDPARWETEIAYLIRE